MNDKQVVTLLKKEFGSKSKAFVLLTQSANGAQAITSSMDVLMKNKKLKGIYITLTKPSSEIKRLYFGSSNICSQLFFIDAVTATLSKVKNEECTAFVAGPNALTELSISLNGATDVGGKEFLFFDSLSTLVMYNGEEKAEKFIHYLINKSVNIGLKTIVFALDDPKTRELIPMVSQFTERFIELK